MDLVMNAGESVTLPRKHTQKPKDSSGKQNKMRKNYFIIIDLDLIDLNFMIEKISQKQLGTIRPSEMMSKRNLNRAEVQRLKRRKNLKRKKSPMRKSRQRTRMNKLKIFNFFFIFHFQKQLKFYKNKFILMKFNELTPVNIFY